MVFIRVLLLGGSGRFSESTARCLANSDIVANIGLAGRNEAALRQRASEVGDKSHSVPLDILDEGHLAEVVADYDVVVNAAGPEWEALLPALRASIKAGTHYCDLGADGRTAERQLQLDSLAKKRDVTAIVGMGFDPGIDNLIAMQASKQFDRVEEIMFCYLLALPDDLLRESVDILRKSGRVDPSWQLVMNNVAGPVSVHQRGSQVTVNPLEHGVEIKSPAGLVATAYPDANPEQITIPRYLPGVPDVSCVCAITPPEMSQLVHREAERITQKESTIKDATRSFLNTVGEDPDRWLKGSAPGWDNWLDVTGLRNGKRGRCKCWPVRVASTGIPLAIAALRILRGEVRVRGVVPPEACFEPMSFLEEVGRRMPPDDQEKPLYGEQMEWLG